MSDDRHAVQADERRAAVFGIVQAAVSLTQGFLTEQISETAREIFLERFFQHLPGKAGDAFHGFERHVAGKAIADDDVDFAVENIASLDVANIAERQLGEQLARRPRELVPFAFLFTNRQQPDPRVLAAEGDPRVSGTHEGELDQMLRAAFDGRAGIEQDSRLLTGGNQRREGRPVDAAGGKGLRVDLRGPKDPTTSRGPMMGGR